MLFTLIAIAAQQPYLTPEEVFDKMLSAYSSAASVKGDITFSQTAYSQATTNAIEARVEVRTDIQRESPNLFFVEQKRTPHNADVVNHFMAVCNGKKMSYTMGKHTLPFLSSRQGESLTMYEDAPKSSGGGLDAFCTLLVDRSFPIALAMNCPYEIKRESKLLTDFRFVKSESKGDEYHIRAKYKIGRQSPQVPYTLPATIVIDKQFNLLSLSIEEPIMVDSRVFSLKSEWKVSLTVNATALDKSKYTVR